MTSSTAGLPLVLRREHFGALLFDPSDGAFLELDADAAAAVRSQLRDPLRRVPEHERALLAAVRSEIGPFDGRAFREVDLPLAEADTPLPVLSGPTLVDFQITDHCALNCPHCYASSTPSGQHGTFADIELGLGQAAEAGAFQVAIGGGEPLSHPDLPRILERCHALGMVPNLTTSGLHLNDTLLRVLKRYCGAVGLSLEGVGTRFDRIRKSGFERFKSILNRLLEHQIPVVLQVTLSVETLADIDAITDFCATQSDLYGVIFLAFKPVGRGVSFGNTLAHRPHADVNAALMKAFTRLAPRTRVGFDCCMTPAMTSVNPDWSSHANEHLDGCSALRTSVGLSPTLDLMPCTFTAAHTVGNLRDQHLLDIWQNLATRRFRSAMFDRAQANQRCSSCAGYSSCLGGCPVMDLADCAQNYLGTNTAAGRDGRATIVVAGPSLT